MIQPNKDILKLVPLFSRFDDEQLTKLSDFIEEKHYKAGEILFRENSTGDTFYIVKEGAVEIYKETEDNLQRVILAKRRQGDFFGELALLQNVPRFATARVKIDCTLLELSKATFISMLYELPMMAFEIMGVLATRLRQADMQLIRDLQNQNASLEKLSRDLEESNRRMNRTKMFLERIISVSPESVVVTDCSGSIFIFNQNARDKYGYHFEEVYRQNVSMLRSPNCPKTAIEEIKSCLENGLTFKGELIDIRKNGEEFINYITACNIMGPSDSVIGILFLGNDITDDKEIQRQWQADDRAATRGQMAAEIAHELNNYISVLSGNLELLPMVMHGNAEEEEVNKKIEAMGRAVERMTIFTEGLMNLTEQKFDFREIDLNDFIEGEIAFLRPQKRFANIRIATQYDDRIDTVRADSGALQQVLYNLMNNAADALNNEGGKEKVIFVETKLDVEKNIVSIIVSDNGPGITGEARDKIFKHSFTTKSGGHGFGLSTTRNIIKAHNGNVRVESQPNKGASFIVSLPIEGSSRKKEECRNEMSSQ